MWLNDGDSSWKPVCLIVSSVCLFAYVFTCEAACLHLRCGALMSMWGNVTFLSREKGQLKTATLHMLSFLSLVIYKSLLLRNSLWGSKPLLEVWHHSRWFPPQCLKDWGEPGSTIWINKLRPYIWSYINITNPSGQLMLQLFYNINGTSTIRPN